MAQTLQLNKNKMHQKIETSCKDTETNPETCVKMSQIYGSLVHTKPDEDKRAKTKNAMICHPPASWAKGHYFLCFNIFF